MDNDTDCTHETVISVHPVRGLLKVRACLDCGYTEVSIAGYVIRRYFATPIVLGEMRKTIKTVEDEMSRNREI